MASRVELFAQVWFLLKYIFTILLPFRLMQCKSAMPVHYFYREMLVKRDQNQNIDNGCFPIFFWRHFDFQGVTKLRSFELECYVIGSGFL